MSAEISSRFEMLHIAQVYQSFISIHHIMMQNILKAHRAGNSCGVIQNCVRKCRYHNLSAINLFGFILLCGMRQEHILRDPRNNSL